MIIYSLSGDRLVASDISSYDVMEDPLTSLDRGLLEFKYKDRSYYVIYECQEFGDRLDHPDRVYSIVESEDREVPTELVEYVVGRVLFYLRDVGLAP